MDVAHASAHARSTPAFRASRASWEAANARDKDAWLALFSSDAVVEDPVGPSMYSADGSGQRGREQLSAFFDQSIAGTEFLDFDMDDCFACGDEIAYTGRIHIGMPGARLTADGVFCYRVDAEGLITSLRAFWEFDRAMAGLTATGPGSGSDTTTGEAR